MGQAQTVAEHCWPAAAVGTQHARDAGPLCCPDETSQV